MLSHTDFSISIESNIFYKFNQKMSFKEVPIAGTNYSKLITSDGFVAVLVSTGYGSDWSTSCTNPSLCKQMILDSRIIQYVGSEEFKKNFSEEKLYDDMAIDYFQQLMATFFSKDILENQYLNIDGFAKLCIQLVIDNSIFRIIEYGGSESIEFFDPNNYMTTV